MTPPDSVLALTTELVKTGTVQTDTLPRVRTMLQEHYGLGVSRASFAQTAKRLGYKRNAVRFIHTGVLLLCNRFLDTTFAIPEGTDRISYAEFLEGRRERLVRLRETAEQEADGPVTPIIRQLLSWELLPKTIQALINNNLLCITKHGAHPISWKKIQDMGRELRGGALAIREWEYDRFEQAAQLLAAVDAGTGKNRRAAMIMDMFGALAEGYSVSDLARTYGFIHKNQVYVILTLARQEMEEDPIVGPMLRHLYEDKRSKHPRRILTIWAMGRVNRNMLPLYRTFRENLGDDPGTRTYQHLSPIERRLLTLVAQGNRFHEIAVRLNMGTTLVQENQNAFFPLPTARHTRDYEMAQTQEAIALLRPLAESIDVWSPYYETLEELLDDIRLMEQLAAGLSAEDIVISNPSSKGVIATNAQRRKILAVVEAIKQGTPAAWKKAQRRL